MHPWKLRKCVLHHPSLLQHPQVASLPSLPHSLAHWHVYTYVCPWLSCTSPVARTPGTVSELGAALACPGTLLTYPSVLILRGTPPYLLLQPGRRLNILQSVKLPAVHPPPLVHPLMSVPAYAHTPGLPLSFACYLLPM